MARTGLTFLLLSLLATLPACGDSPAEGASDAGSLPDGGGSGSPDGGSGGWDGGSLGPVQCRTTADCSGPMPECRRDAPGGICGGCSSPSDCPDELEFDCFMAACVRLCAEDSDCNAGMFCAQSGMCGKRSCSETKPCPAPYTCGPTGYCARPACPGGTCPAPLVCQDALCVEP